MEIVKVQLNYRSATNWDWRKEVREFTLLPRIGEHIQLSSEFKWLKVDQVIHDLSQSEFDFTIYAIEDELAISFMGDVERSA